MAVPLIALPSFCCAHVLPVPCTYSGRHVGTAHCFEVDVSIVADLRSFLFINPGNVAGLDLAVFNIQRGRQHGLPDYNSMREVYGLPRLTCVTAP